MAPARYLTKEEIIKELKLHLGKRRFTVFWEEVNRQTGMSISYSHLFNIVRGIREPNEVVMRYLGGEVDKSEIYRIDRPGKSRGKKG